MITGIIETALYVGDVARSVQFFETVLDFKPMVQDATFCALDVAGRDVLLLFKQGSTAETQTFPGGTIPSHDGCGTTHAGFAVSAADLPAWEARLTKHNVAIEGRMKWSRGGESIYFRDPDGHLLELLTPGVWSIY